MGQYYGLAGTWQEGATLVGSETIVASGTPPDGEDDSPEPGPVGRGDKRALLAVVDSRGRARCWGMPRQSGYWRDVLALVAQSTPVEYLAYLERRRVPYLIVGQEKVDYCPVLAGTGVGLSASAPMALAEWREGQYSHVWQRPVSSRAVIQ